MPCNTSVTQWDDDTHNLVATTTPPITHYWSPTVAQKYHISMHYKLMTAYRQCGVTEILESTWCVMILFFCRWAKSDHLRPPKWRPSTSPLSSRPFSFPKTPQSRDRATQNCEACSAFAFSQRPSFTPILKIAMIKTHQARGHLLALTAPSKCIRQLHGCPQLPPEGWGYFLGVRGWSGAEFLFLCPNRQNTKSVATHQYQQCQPQVTTKKIPRGYNNSLKQCHVIE